MLNQVVLVGRLARDLEIEKKEDKKVTKIILAVPRSFKNENGEYETDFLPVYLYDRIAENTVEYCKKGDLVGIKGRLSSKDEKVWINAEKVTFLTSSNKKEED